jgi:hypothetical protein
MCLAGSHLHPCFQLSLVMFKKSMSSRNNLICPVPNSGVMKGLSGSLDPKGTLPVLSPLLSCKCSCLHLCPWCGQVQSNGHWNEVVTCVGQDLGKETSNFPLMRGCDWGGRWGKRDNGIQDWCRFGQQPLLTGPAYISNQSTLRFLIHLSLRDALWIIKEFHGISSRRIYLSNVIHKF